MTKTNTQPKMTVGDALKWGVASLEKESGTVSAAYREARDLLCHALRRDEAWLISHDQDELQDKSRDRYTELVLRRAQNEPLAYSLGNAWFLGREFKVTADTLIPRPATEHVVEAALAAAEKINAVNMIDVGTGSGVIAASLALGRPQSRVWATDASAEALSVAAENAETLRATTIEFRKGNLLEPLPEEVWGEPTAIAANLPYIPETDWENLAPEIKNFEPKSALTSGTDGLDHYRELIEQLLQRRKNAMTLCVEILPKQEPALTELIHRTWPEAGTQPIKNLIGDTVGLTCVIR